MITLNHEIEDFAPEGLTLLPNFVLWRKESKPDGEITKVPYSPNYNGKASSTNPNSWNTIEKTICAAKQYFLKVDGIGFVVTKESSIVFIDIDDCIDVEGNLSQIADDVMNAFGGRTYCELSPSGRGLHFFAYGEIPRSFKNSFLGVEMYCEKRYGTLTFKSVCPVNLSHEQEALDYLFEKYKTKENEPKNEVPNMVQKIDLDDKSILDKAQKNERFNELFFKGVNDYKSHSEADLALCCMLAFWTDRDRNKIDNLFRASSLYRSKWEREDYRNTTIRKACVYCTESLSEYIDRKESFKRNEIRKYYTDGDFR